MGNVRKRGKSWTAQVRMSGWQSFTKTFETKSFAQEWIKHTEYALKSNVLPDYSVHSMTLYDLLDRYAEEVSSNLKSSEIEIYKLRLIQRYPVSKNKLSYLTKKHFENYRDERLKEVKSGTVHAEIMLLKRVYKVAIEQWGYGIIKNPLASIIAPAPHKPRKRRLTRKEQIDVCIAAKLQRNDYICSIIEFAIETGMRRSEILKLKWQDINLETGFALLYDTKNGEDRKVPLTLKCIQLLNQLSRSHEHVFPISATCLNQAWRRAVRKAEIKDLRFHDLRHEAVSRFFEMGMNIAEVALISGHKDVKQLFRYTHLNPENVFKKYDAFQNRADT